MSALWCEFNQEEKIRGCKVLKIKAILEKHVDCKSETVVYESLKKFHKMGLSFKVVDAAGIGITVSRLQDHVSKEVKQIANMIIGPWMRRSVWGPVLLNGVWVNLQQQADRGCCHPTTDVVGGESELESIKEEEEKRQVVAH
ncbi:transcription elongation factor TFIIS/CRSP70 [Tanacetum coccineum]